MDTATPAVRPAAAAARLAALLPTLPTAAARASRLLHDRRLGPLWQALDDAGGSLSPASGPGTGRLFDVMVECDAGTFALAVATSDDAALALAIDAGIAAPLRALALDALFGPVLERLSRLALPGARIAAARALARQGTPATGWCALRRDGVELARIAVQELPASVASRLREARGPAPVRADWRARLRRRGAAVIATRRIALGVLRSLEPGDVVLPEQALESLEGAPATFRMEAGAGRGLAASAQVADGRLVLLGVPRMTDDDALAAPPTGATAIDELELPLQFELETVSITLAELESIEPGYVIEFDTPANQARLRLVSCGVVVGEADLVAVGGRLGACITHLAPRHDADQQRS